MYFCFYNIIKLADSIISINLKILIFDVTIFNDFDFIILEIIINS